MKTGIYLSYIGLGAKIASRPILDQFVWGSEPSGKPKNGAKDQHLINTWKIRYSHRSEYVLRPDFINTIRMFNKYN